MVSRGTGKRKTLGTPSSLVSSRVGRWLLDVGGLSVLQAQVIAAEVLTHFQ